jgi:peptide/nickel transport system substrate-binding protein
MQRIRLTSWLLLTVIVATLALAGCSSPTASSGTPVQTIEVRGGSLVVAIAANPDGFDPHKVVAAATFQVSRNIYDTLVRTDDQSRIQPELAEKWAPSSDGLKWTFTLREGVKFQNGRVLTSDDVKYSFDRILDKATASPRAADYAVIQSVTAPDARTVVFELKQAQTAFLSNLAYGWTAIVPKEAVDTLSDKPVGTGPFKLVEWVKDGSVTLERNPDYFVKGQPYLDKVVFRVITDSAARLAALRAGEVDVIPELPAQEIAAMRKDSAFHVIEQPFNGNQLLAINNKQAPFDNVKVRQALEYAIDKKAVIDTAQFGIGVPIGSHLPPATDYYVDLTSKYPYNPEKAKQLLAEAGFPTGFETTIILPQPYDYHIRNGQAIAEQLAKVGIKCKLETLEWGTYLSQVYNGRQYALTTLGHTGRLDPDPFLNRYVSTSKENYMNYSNPKYDELAAQGAVETDLKKRHEIYAQMQTLLADDAAAVYLLSPTSSVTVAKSVQGWIVYPIDIYDLRTVWKQAK